MTEPISYDTRQAPTTAPVATPRPIQQPQVQRPPIQQPIDQQVIGPAPINHRAAKPSVHQPPRYGLLVVAAFFVLMAVGGGAFLLLKQGDALSSAATNLSTPTSTATPIPATPIPATPSPDGAQEDELKNAREAETEERYQQAIILYGQYQVKHALDTDPRVKEVLDHKLELEKFYGLVNMGVFETSKGDYAAAERNYADALKLRPDSKMAQEGLKKAKSKQGRAY